MADQTYSEQVRDPSLALNPPQTKQEQKSDGLTLRQWLFVLIVVNIIIALLLARYRPDLLRKLVEKLGVHFGGGGSPGGINPMGWK